jgi:hypothetical protein
MTMNKREQAEVAELRHQLALARALRCTPVVLPDVPIPTRFHNLVKGFLYCASQSAWRVEPACSSCHEHSFGNNDKTTIRDGKKLFSTRLLALRALRNDAERQCAEWLAAIDAMIDREPTP